MKRKFVIATMLCISMFMSAMGILTFQAKALTEPTRIVDITKYRSLYVQDGLSRNWDTFDASINVANGVNYWVDLVTEEGMYCGNSTFDENKGAIVLGNGQKMSLVNNGDPNEATNKYGYYGAGTDISIQMTYVPTAHSNGSALWYKSVQALAGSEGNNLNTFTIYGGDWGNTYQTTTDNRVVGTYGNFKPMDFTYQVAVDDIDTTNMQVDAFFGCEKVLSGAVANNTEVNMEFFTGGNADVYSLRIYTKILSEQEIAQNHFADLVCITEIDSKALSTLVDMSAEMKNVLYNQFKTTLIENVTSADIEEAIFGVAKLGKLTIDDQMIAKYNSLYVSNGLVRNWNGYYGEMDVANWGSGDVYYWKDIISNDGLYCGSSSYSESERAFIINGESKMSLVNNGQQSEATNKYGYSGEGTDVTIQLNYLPTNGGTSLYYKGVSAKSNVSGSDVTSFVVEGSGINYQNTTDARLVGSLDSLKPQTFTYSVLVDEPYENMTVKAYVGANNLFSQTVADSKDVNMEFMLNGNAKVYNVRIYNRILSEGEIAQNHFADLVNNVKIDAQRLDDLSKLTKTQRAYLYTTFINRNASNTTSADLENAIIEAKNHNADRTIINNVYNAESVTLSNGQTNENVVASDIIKFKGYEARLLNEVALRAIFEIDETAISMVEDLGYKVEYGASMGLASTTNQNVSLTLSNQGGNYRVNNQRATNISVYKTTDGKFGKFVKVGDTTSEFACALTFTTAQEMTETMYNTKCVYCGYVIISNDSETYILYADMTNETFGAEVSVKEVYRTALFNDLQDTATIEAVCGEDEILASKSLNKAMLDEISDLLSQMDSVIVDMERINNAFLINNAELLSNGEIAKNSNDLDAMTVVINKAFLNEVNYKDALLLRARYVEIANEVDSLVADYSAQISASLNSQNKTNIVNTILTANGYVGNYKDRASVVSTFNGMIDVMCSQSKAENNIVKNLVRARAQTFDYLTINGIDVEDYVIIVDESNVSQATALQKGIIEKYGVAVPVCFDNTSSYAHEIIVGATDRGESSDAAAADKTVSCFNDKIVLMDANFYDLSQVVEGFINHYLVKEVLTIDNGEIKTMDEYLDLGLPKVYGKLTNKEYTFDTYNSDALWEIFNLAKDEIPDEVNVIKPIDENAFPLSMQNTIFVATNGNDSNAGTIEQPLATLQTAVNKALEMDGAVIYLRGGTYQTNNQVTHIVNKHYSENAPLFITNYQDEKVTITNSGVTVNSNDFELVNASSNPKIVANRDRLESSIRNNVYAIDLGALGYTANDVGQNTPTNTPNLYVGDQVKTLARYPNVSTSPSGENLLTTVLWTGSCIPSSHIYNAALQAEYDARPGWTVCYGDALRERVNRWNLSGDVSAKDIWVGGNLYQDWHKGRYHIVNIDTSVGSFTSENTCGWGAYQYFRNRTYVYNVLEELDEAGEWYIDRDNMIMYYYPTEDNFTSLNQEVSLTSRGEWSAMFNINNVNNLVINGLTITKTRGTGVQIMNCHNLLIQNCKVTNTTYNGITVENCSNTGIIYSEFYGAYTSSVLMKGNKEARRTLTPTHNFVQNCFFHDNFPDSMYSCEFNHEVGGVFSHNEVEGAVLSGSNSETIFEYNEIYEGVYQSIEGGGIYVGNGSEKSSRGNHYRYNYFHDFLTGDWAMAFDDMSACDYVYGNVVDATTGSIKYGVSGNNSREMVISNNVFIGVKYPMDEGYNYTEGGGQSYRWYLYVEWLKEDYDYNQSQELFDRYPLYELYSKTILDAYDEMYGGGSNGELGFSGDHYARAAAYMTYKNNVTINCEYQLMTYYNVGKYTSFDESNKDYKTTDLGFVDYENRDLALKYNSKIYEDVPEFYEIPFYKMGRTV